MDNIVYYAIEENLIILFPLLVNIWILVEIVIDLDQKS